MTQQTPKSCQFCTMFNDCENFCALLSPDELADLGDRSQMLTVKRGETLAGGMVKRWPVLAISKGVLSLQHLLNDGRRTIAALFMRGDVLDLRKGSNRHIGSLVALDKVSLCRLSPIAFDKILCTNTRARILAWENLSEQNFRAIDHASDLAKKRALEKLASFIFECRHRGEPNTNGALVEIPIRRRDLAEYLGMQPETISRCFKVLESRGIIKVTDLSVIRLESVPALRRIANGDRDAQAADRFNGPVLKIMTASA